MRIMLTGANGQVGWELSRSLMTLGEVIALTRSQCDLSSPETLPGIVQEIKPDIIVNAAACTAVDKAEEEEKLAHLINSISVGVLAEEAKRNKALFIHYSTDYVFDGTKSTPYTEEDSPNPVNVYGFSKLEGEKAIRQVNSKHLILRTSWVYARRGRNFPKTILKLAEERDEFEIIADQFGSPTNAKLIADITCEVLSQLAHNSDFLENVAGIYHMTASGNTSWHGYARFVLEMAIKNGQRLRITPNQVRPIKVADYSLPAKRPANSCLDTDKIQSVFALDMVPWRVYVESTVSEILSEG